MPKIIISRRSEYENRIRKMKVEIDGEVKGKIKNGQTVEFSVESGKHIVQAKIDWCTSNIIELNLNDQVETQLELGAGSGSSLHKITFGSNNYLELKVVETNKSS